MDPTPSISTDGVPSDNRAPQSNVLSTTPTNEPDPYLETASSAPLSGTNQTHAPLSSTDQSLENALASLSVEQTRPNEMFRALASIFQASQMHEGRLDLEQQENDTDIWTILQRAEESSNQGLQDVAALVAISGVLTQMLWYGSQLLLPAVKIMADTSREEIWRLPFGQGGVLAFALATVASGTASEDVQIHSLRVIGNSCADTDENRALVLDNSFLPVLISLVENPRLTSVAVPVLYNILCDYEPAQIQANNNDLFPTLIRVLEAGTLDNTPTLTYLCRLLELAPETMNLEQSPDNTVEVLLRAATKPSLDVENCVSLADTAIAHLKLDSFQRHLVNRELFGVPLRFLIRSYFPKANLSGSVVPPIGTAAAHVRESSEEAELSRIRKDIISVLSDVSALPEFAANHSSLTTPLVESLVKWLSASLPQLQLCSCIVLGNLARSDDVCRAMVSRLHLHKDLISMLRTNTESQVLHSVLGFLRNLALPLGNKQALGDSGAFEALTRFWTSDSLPVVSHLAAAVARQLLNGCIYNVQRILTSLSADTESPAHSKTYLSLLFSLFEKSDDVTIKMEIARIIAAILRCINSDSTLSPESKSQLLQRLYNLHPTIGQPLGMMVSQSQYPIIRSEGWFAMALMARSPEGGSVIQSIVSQLKVVAALEDTISGEISTNTTSGRGSPTMGTPGSDLTGPLSPESQQEVSSSQRAKDRENAMVLVNELLKAPFDEIHGHIQRGILEELLRAGTRAGRS